MPQRVASAASKCHKCFSIDTYRVTFIMPRSGFEDIVTGKIQDPANECGKGQDPQRKIQRCS